MYLIPRLINKKFNLYIRKRIFHKGYVLLEKETINDEEIYVYVDEFKTLDDVCVFVIEKYKEETEDE
jgi:hypothetical protein